MKKANKVRSAFNEVKEDWFKDLPLVDLRGLDENEKHEAILSTIRNCIEKVPLEITEENEEEFESRHNFMSTHQDGNESAIIITTYYPETSFAGVNIFYGMVPISRSHDVYEMINLLNLRSSIGRFCVYSDTGTIVLKAATIITQYFNVQELFLLIRHMLASGYKNIPLIKELLSTDQAPLSILEKHADTMREFMKVNPDLFENQK